MIRIKKSLGQHFLHEQKYAIMLSEALSAGTKNLVEVGPGRGMLTRYLVPLAEHLLLIEKDTALAGLMRKSWSGHPHVSVEEGDVLTFDFVSYFGGDPFSVAGNFPYNISSQIVFRVLELYQYIPEMVGMFQLEMGRRIAAGPGSKEYGIISVMTAVRFEAELLFTIPPEAFNPPPKVISAVIRLVRKPERQLPCADKSLRTIVRTSFGQRRKMLRNSLRALFPVAALTDTAFQRRPEQLTPDEFIDIACLYERLTPR